MEIDEIKRYRGGDIKYFLILGGFFLVLLLTMTISILFQQGPLMRNQMYGLGGFWLISAVIVFSVSIFELRIDESYIESRIFGLTRFKINISAIESAYWEHNRYGEYIKLVVTGSSKPYQVVPGMFADKALDDLRRVLGAKLEE